MRFSVPIRVLVVLLSISLTIGCGSAADLPPFESSVQIPSADRNVIRSGDIVVSAEFPGEVAKEVESVVNAAGGFVERSVANDTSAALTCRVPAGQLGHVMNAIAELGYEERRSVSAEDVTEQYIDLASRIRNQIVLRETVRKLLQDADDMDEILSLEKELSRLQATIETMQAHFEQLKADVAFASLSVKLQHKRVLGPISYVGRGAWKVVSKLFVLR